MLLWTLSYLHNFSLLLLRKHRFHVVVQDFLLDLPQFLVADRKDVLFYEQFVVSLQMLL